MHEIRLPDSKGASNMVKSLSIMNFAKHMIVVTLLVGIETTFGQNGDPHPAASSFSGCKIKWPLNGGCYAKLTVLVQAGQCWANTRIANQKSAYFVPVPPTTPGYNAQGGPYGICTGCNWVPKATDLVASNNPADFCFFWHDAAHPVLAPGKPTIPMPIICPSNLNPCPSLNWYEPGNKLGMYADWKSAYEGVWFGPRDKPPSYKALYCNGLNLGCETLTNRDFQFPRIVGKCDVTKCRPRS
ncbi:uncharacterized protein [Bemisia tabaci]